MACPPNTGGSPVVSASPRQTGAGDDPYTTTAYAAGTQRSALSTSRCSDAIRSARDRRDRVAQQVIPVAAVRVRAGLVLDLDEAIGRQAVEHGSHLRVRAVRQRRTCPDEEPARLVRLCVDDTAIAEATRRTAFAVGTSANGAG
jgi:hypothetical protein